MKGRRAAATGAAVSFLCLSLLHVGTLPASAEWRDGFCREGEGQTVIVDWRLHPEATGTTSLVRCIALDPGNPQWPAADGNPHASPLRSAEIEYRTEGVVTGINGIETSYGYWHMVIGYVTDGAGTWGTSHQPEPSIDSFVGYTLTLAEAEQPELPPQFAPPLPTEEPTSEPTEDPTGEPTDEPTEGPTGPTGEPTDEPTGEPSDEPTAEPTVQPTVEPTVEPTSESTAEPTVERTAEPTDEPSVEPTTRPGASGPRNRPKFPRTTRPNLRPPTTPPQQTVTPSVAPSASPEPSSPPEPAPTAPPSEAPGTQAPGSAPSPQPVWGREATERTAQPASVTPAQAGNPFNAILLGLLTLVGLGAALGAGVRQNLTAPVEDE